jgi:predicted dehydrogenase
MDGKPRIGVVGTGWWATQHHIPSLKGYEGAELMALADTDPKALRRAAAACDVAKTFLDPRELYASGLVDGVVIAIPHAYHYEEAQAALDAGLHVLLEKPMTLRADHAYDLVARAEAAGRVLMIGLTYQHTRAAQRLRKAVQEGQLGEITLVSGLYVSMVEEYYRGRPERYQPVFQFPVTGPNASTYADPVISGGGHGQTQVTHAMGMVLYVTGKRVASVSAVMSELGTAVDVVDAMSYRFAGGGIGTMAASGAIRPGQESQQELRYYGTEGYALQDLLGGTLSIHRNDGSVERLDPPLAGDEVYPAELPARAFVDLVADPLADNLSPAGPAADTVAFLEAAYASARGGGTPVAVAVPNTATGSA